MKISTQISLLFWGDMKKNLLISFIKKELNNFFVAGKVLGDLEDYILFNLSIDTNRHRLYMSTYNVHRVIINSMEIFEFESQIYFIFHATSFKIKIKVSPKLLIFQHA